MPTKENEIREQLRTLLGFATAIAQSTTAGSTYASPTSLFQTISDWRLAEDIAKRLVTPGKKMQLLPIDGKLLVEHDLLEDLPIAEQPDAVELDARAFRDEVLAHARFTGDYRVEHEGAHTILRMKARTREAPSELSEIVLVIHRSKVVGAVVPWTSTST